MKFPKSISGSCRSSVLWSFLKIWDLEHNWCYPKYTKSQHPQQEYFPLSQNPTVGSSSSQQRGDKSPENLTFSLSDFLGQQNRLEVAPILQESTSETDSLGEVEIKPFVFHLFENPLFSTPQTEISSIQTFVSASFPFVPQRVMAHPTPTRILQIIVAIYVPLVPPQPLHPLP